MELKIQPRMHFLFAREVARRGFWLRLVEWDGSEGGQPLRWIRYLGGGLWAQIDGEGEHIIQSGEITAADLLSWNWTTLRPDCEGLTTAPDMAELLKVRPFFTVPGLGSGVIGNPNGCDTGTIVVDPGTGTDDDPKVPDGPGGPGIGDDSGGGGGGGTGGGSGGGSGGGVDRPPFRPRVSPDLGGGGGGSTRGGGGGGGRRRPRGPRATSIPTASLSIARGGAALEDGCIQRAEDTCGRRCEDAPAASYGVTGAGFPYQYLGATITLGADADEPGSIWAYSYYFKGEIRETGHIAAGTSKDVDVGSQTYHLNMGASHGGSVTFYRSGRTVSANATTGAVPDYCEKPEDCGDPCTPAISVGLAVDVTRTYVESGSGCQPLAVDGTGYRCGPGADPATGGRVDGKYDCTYVGAVASITEDPEEPGSAWNWRFFIDSPDYLELSTGTVTAPAASFALSGDPGALAAFGLGSGTNPLFRIEFTRAGRDTLVADWRLPYAATLCSPAPECGGGGSGMGGGDYPP